MNKQLVLRKIETDLKFQPELKLACCAFVEFVSKHKPEDLLQITFGLISRTAQIEVVDAIPVAHYFTGPLNHILDKKFLFSYFGEDYEIDDSLISDARNGNIFYHPDTGEEVSNYEEYIFLYFVLSDNGLSLAKGEL